MVTTARAQSKNVLRSKTVAHFIAQRGVTEGGELDRFLDPRLSDLTSPDEMADRTTIAQRLAQAIRQGDRIVVFGDYDCDGMTSTAILCDVIEELGGVSHPILASRFDGGYGVSERALEKILAAEPRLLVTCDCGSSDHATLSQVTAAGIDVVVIDHHLVPKEKLPVLAFLNPHRSECRFPYKGLASCGLVLSVAAALRTEMGAQLDLRRWLDLVAIGTVADVAPLTGDNRALVRAGLSTLRRAERPGIAALLDVVKLDRQYPFSAGDIGFRIAPRLNAPGRMQAPDLAFQLMREKDPERARVLADEVEILCQKRRADQLGIEEQAVEQVVRAQMHETSALVVGAADWNHGIVGIVAGRLAEKYALPTVIVGFEDGVGRGSLRGPDGFPLFDALSECSEYLVRFGGHQAAAGLEILEGRLDEFRSAYQAACSRHADYQRPAGVEDLKLQPGDQLKDVLHDLYLLEPCGEKNPSPTLRLSCKIRAAREVRGGHLKLDMELADATRVGGFGPNLGSQARQISGVVEVIGELRPDRYRGGDAVELLVKRVDC